MVRVTALLVYLVPIIFTYVLTAECPCDVTTGSDRVGSRDKNPHRFHLCCIDHLVANDSSNVTDYTSVIHYRQFRICCALLWLMRFLINVSFCYSLLQFCAESSTGCVRHTYASSCEPRRSSVGSYTWLRKV